MQFKYEILSLCVTRKQQPTIHPPMLLALVQRMIKHTQTCLLSPSNNDITCITDVTGPHRFCKTHIVFLLVLCCFYFMIGSRNLGVKRHLVEPTYLVSYKCICVSRCDFQTSSTIILSFSITIYCLCWTGADGFVCCYTFDDGSMRILIWWNVDS